MINEFANLDNSLSQSENIAVASIHPIKDFLSSSETVSESIEMGEFHYAAQHIRSLDSAQGSPRWFEWLVRPRFLERRVDAGEFIEAAHQLGLMTELDKRIVIDALSWLRLQPINTRLSINVSAASISNVAFTSYVVNAIRRFRIVPEQVCFEITEHQAITDLGTATRFSKTVRNMGAQIALDDVGAGTMHLGLFAPLHLVDFIKIDRNWIIPALDSPAHRRTAEGLIDFGKRMGVGIIAEGVETHAHLELVRKLNVDFYQGFIDGQPCIVVGGYKEKEEEFRGYSRTA